MLAKILKEAALLSAVIFAILYFHGTLAIEGFLIELNLPPEYVVPGIAVNQLLAHGFLANLKLLLDNLIYAVSLLVLFPVARIFWKRIVLRFQIKSYRNKNKRWLAYARRAFRAIRKSLSALLIIILFIFWTNMIRKAGEDLAQNWTFYDPLVRILIKDKKEERTLMAHVLYRTDKDAVLCDDSLNCQVIPLTRILCIAGE